MPRAFGLRPLPFDNSIGRNGIRLRWAKGHVCPCTYSGGVSLGVTGSGRPECQTCYGYGIYWDTPTDPFIGLITIMNMTRSPDEPGIHLDNKWGPMIATSPNVTFSYTQQPEVWENASVNDLVIEVDSLARFNTVLTVGQNQAVPYVENLTIEPTGAVTTWNSATSSVTTGIPYTVAGNKVSPIGLPSGKSFVVEFTAAPTYLLFRKPGGLPHNRPFGGGVPQNEPKRFQVITLDLWARQINTIIPDNAVSGSNEAGVSFPLNQAVNRS